MKIEDCIYLRRNYNLIKLESGWVKLVLRFIDESELKINIPSGHFLPDKINQNILNKGIHIIKIRKGVFKSTEFHITGIWDY